MLREGDERQAVLFQDKAPFLLKMKYVCVHICASTCEDADLLTFHVLS